MTPTRAREIYDAARAQATCGPWSDQLDNVMTPDERREIVAVWETMPGNSCFVDALFRVMNLRQISRAEYDAIHSDFRGVWDTEREDWKDWPKVREQYMGKRTMMAGDGSCSLLVEGLGFIITD